MNIISNGERVRKVLVRCSVVYVSDKVWSKPTAPPRPGVKKLTTAKQITRVLESLGGWKNEWSRFRWSILLDVPHHYDEKAIVEQVKDCLVPTLVKERLSAHFLREIKEDETLLRFYVPTCHVTRVDFQASLVMTSFR